MSLFERLKADQLAYRKQSSTAIRAKEFAATLGTIIAEASKNDKNPSDDVVIATLRKTIKGLEEVLRYTPDEMDYQAEWHMLSAYVPKMLTVDQLHLALCAENFNNLTIEMKNMKAIKEHLETKFPGQIDGKLLADIVKSF